MSGSSRFWREALFAVLSFLIPVSVEAHTPSQIPHEAAPSNDGSAESRAAAELEWMKSTLLPSGAIARTPSKTVVNPWQSSLAALGALSAGDVTVARGWLGWYFAHLKAPATEGRDCPIPIHDVLSGVEMPRLGRTARGEPACSTSDNLLAAGLLLANRYHQRSKDDAFIRANLSKLKLIKSELDRLFQPNGLTRAGLSNHTQYKMNNDVVWAGYHEFGELLDRMNIESELAKQCAARAERIDRAIESEFWDPRREEYRSVARMPAPVDWSRFYPDAVANIYGLNYSVPSQKKRARMLGDKFLARQKEWLSKGGDSSPWFGLTAALLEGGHHGAAALRESNLRRAFIQKESTRAIPYSSHDAGAYLEYLSRIGNSMTTVDDSQATKTGAWKAASGGGAFFGAGYLHDGGEGKSKGRTSVRFVPRLAEAGRYEVLFTYSSGPDRSREVPIRITHASGSERIIVNEKIAPVEPVSLGIFEFKAGDSASVEISTEGTVETVSADAVIFRRASR